MYPVLYFIENNTKRLHNTIFFCSVCVCLHWFLDCKTQFRSSFFTSSCVNPLLWLFDHEWCLFKHSCVCLFILISRILLKATGFSRSHPAFCTKWCHKHTKPLSTKQIHTEEGKCELLISIRENFMETLRGSLFIHVQQTSHPESSSYWSRIGHEADIFYTFYMNAFDRPFYPKRL